MVLVSSRRIVTLFGIACLTVGVLCASPAASEEMPPARAAALRASLVGETADAWSGLIVARCRIRPRTGWGTGEPSSFVFRTEAAAPKAVVSRDRFVAFAARARWMVLGALTAEQSRYEGLQAMRMVKCEPLGSDAEIDHSLQIDMRAEGLFLELKRQGADEPQTLELPWAEVLGY